MTKEGNENKTADVRPETVQAELVPNKKELTPEEKKRKYMQGLIKTLIGVVIGSAAGGLCYMMFGAAATTAWFLLLAVVAVFAYYIQRRLIFPALKLALPERGIEWIGNVLLVLIYCFVVWTMLLNTGVPVWTGAPSYDDTTNEITFMLDRDAVVSYVVLDERVEKRKDVGFDEAIPVTVSPVLSTNTNGKQVTVYKGSFTEDIDGKYVYIRAAVDSSSLNDAYVKGTVFELAAVRDEEPEKKSLFA